MDSYTRLTMNADVHPLMRRMHKPDPKLGPDEQDKRSVVGVEPPDWDTWIGGTTAEASKLVRLAPPELFAPVRADSPLFVGLRYVAELHRAA